MHLWVPYMHLREHSNPFACFHSLEAALPPIRNSASSHWKECKKAFLVSHPTAGESRRPLSMRTLAFLICNLRHINDRHNQFWSIFATIFTRISRALRLNRRQEKKLPFSRFSRLIMFQVRHNNLILYI